MCNIMPQDLTERPGRGVSLRSGTRVRGAFAEFERAMNLEMSDGFFAALHRAPQMMPPRRITRSRRTAPRTAQVAWIAPRSRFEYRKSSG